MANNGKIKTENIVLEYTANTKDVVEQVGKVTKSLEQLHNEIEKLNNLKICIEIETTQNLIERKVPKKKQLLFVHLRYHYLDGLKGCGQS